jgi:hypothetical protein
MNNYFKRLITQTGIRIAADGGTGSVTGNQARLEVVEQLAPARNSETHPPAVGQETPGTAVQEKERVLSAAEEKPAALRKKDQEVTHTPPAPESIRSSAVKEFPAPPKDYTQGVKDERQNGQEIEIRHTALNTEQRAAEHNKGRENRVVKESQASAKIPLISAHTFEKDYSAETKKTDQLESNNAHEYAQQEINESPAIIKTPNREKIKMGKENNQVKARDIMQVSPPRKEFYIKDVLAWVNEDNADSVKQITGKESESELYTIKPAAPNPFPEIQRTEYESDISISIGSINLSLEGTEERKQPPPEVIKPSPPPREKNDPFFWQRNYLNLH